MGTALRILLDLFPLLLRAVQVALQDNTCPRESMKAVLDAEEAAAIVAENLKFPS